MKPTTLILCAAFAAGCNSKPAESPTNDMVVPPGSRTAVQDDGSSTGRANTSPASGTSSDMPSTSTTRTSGTSGSTTNGATNGTSGNTTSGKGITGNGPTSSSDGRTMPPDAAGTAVGAAQQPDNTGVNKRDASGAALTAGDQSNAKSDVDITASIRKAVVGDSSLSTTAKNVKIITIKGKVTLRGPVKSDDERSKIEAAAKRVAGDAQVDNQLEVKTK